MQIFFFFSHFLTLFFVFPACYLEDNELSGVIKSPSYPTFYPLEAYCEARVDVPRGNVIRFKVQDLDLCASPNNTVTLVDGDGPGKRMQPHMTSISAMNYCG